jgi:FkbM family methyltransferase
MKTFYSYRKIFTVFFLFILSFFILSKTNSYNKIRSYFILRDCPLCKQLGNDKLYSQSFEDYILSIVFANKEKGNYVDVGANNPLGASVTLYFYEKGWKGINIEPQKKWYDALNKERPKDVNLNIGISNKEGILKFYHFESAEPLSTFDREIAENHSKDGKLKYIELDIPVLTLTDVLIKNPFPEIINFIKIDVEGLEKEVLEGLDLTNFRPQVFVIEATLPNTSIPSHEPWEPILLNNNYEFMVSDGLNRYYLAKEHKEELLNNFIKAAKCTWATKKYYKYFKDHSAVTYNPELF